MICLLVRAGVETEQRVYTASWSGETSASANDDRRADTVNGNAHNLRN